MSHPAVTLAEARLSFDAEGVPYSEQFGDVYHSAEGGPGQSRHVFLGGNQLPQRWRNRDCYTIVETGFGLGLNFLETWRAWEADDAAPARLSYVSVEHQPFSPQSLSQAHDRWPDHAARSRALIDAWPLPLRGYHRLHLAGGHLTLTLLLGDVQACLSQLQAQADALYLDGFSPARNPDMWSPAVFKQLARIARPGSTLATWSVAGAVREGLAQAGFQLEKRPGFRGKREMLTGTRIGPVTALPPSHTRALVIGAGLAGSACAARLAERGWEVQVLERHAAPAGEASGNPLGLCAPLVNIADGANAQISRAAFGYAQRHYARLHSEGDPLILQHGVLRILRSLQEADRYQPLLEQAYPAALARYLSPSDAATLLGMATSRPGIWFSTGMSLDPARVCSRQLQPPGIRTVYESTVSELVSVNGLWHARSARGRVLAEAEQVVVAAGMGSLAFAPSLRLESVRGQITLLPADPQRVLSCAVSGEGYGMLMPDGRLLIGATFQPGDNDTGLRSEDHASNMARMEVALPGLCRNAQPEDAQGRVGFRAVTPDRLPIAGEPGPAGLHVLTGLGARGLAWAPLGAELLASRMAGDPLPLPADLIAELLPSRFDMGR